MIVFPIGHLGCSLDRLAADTPAARLMLDRELAGITGRPVNRQIRGRLRYDDLFDAPAGTDQPTARPVSLIDGKPMEIRSGPNWDDDLSGSNIYAAQDPNLEGLSAQERWRLFSLV